MKSLFLKTNISKNIFLIVITLVLGFFALGLGSVHIGYDEILSFFMGEEISNSSKIILFDVRLPRVIMAILIGMLLASSGVVVQSVFLNPLADPYIIGIAASATFGAVVAYLLGLPDIFYGLFAFISSSILSILIFKLSRKGKSVATLLIIGIAFSSFLGAFTSFFTYMIGENSFKIVAWMMGYLGSASWDKIGFLIIPVVLSFIYFYLKRFELNIILSGDEEAQSLGIDVEKSKKRLLIVASLIVGFSVAFTGMIGFVGLIIPHTVRLLARTSNNIILIPLSTILGGIFLLVCDSIGRTIFQPIEIPIGVITAFFGAPFFLYLAIMSKRGIA